MQANLVVRALATLALIVAPSMGEAQVGNPDPSRFSEEIENFASWDSKNFVPRGGIVLVGSSSIRFWPSSDRFPGLPIVNRGFGGAHISDVNHFVDETVLKYAPELVVFYAGDNDIAAGKPPAQVFADYQLFVERVLEAQPRTQILFISVKPSISRWERWPEMVEVNRMVREYTDGRLNLHFTDVATPMLRSGDPDPAHFIADGLHMTPAGYDIWTEVVGSSIARILK